MKFKLNPAQRKAVEAANVRKARQGKPLTKLQKKEVKGLIKGAPETKRTNWYNSFNDGTVSGRATGLFVNAGWANQNNQISNNNTDILRLVPQIVQGVDDFERLGDRVTVNSLTVKGEVRVALGRLTAFAQSDIRVCIFVLQHKQYKDYQTLYANNNFGQLLDIGDGTTSAFKGIPPNETMRVADQYYTVCKKKIITLRYAGSTVNNPTADLSIANSHNYYGTFSMNLTKKIPKILKFPETGSGLPAEWANTPTNTSLFMSVGFVDQQSTPSYNGNPGEATKGWLQQTYTTYLTYKDA